MKKIISLILSLALILTSMWTIQLPAYGLTTMTEKTLVDACLLDDGNILILYVSEDVLYSGKYTPGLQRWEKVAVTPGKTGALALDHNGIPHIAFISMDDEIGYASFNGTSWSTEIILESLDIGGEGVLMVPDLTFDPSGKAYISYHDSRAGSGSLGDYTSYDKEDLMVATNATGTWVSYVRSYSGGWFYSPDGSRNWAMMPSKIVFAGGDYAIGLKSYNYDKSMWGQYHTYTYSVLRTPAVPSQDISWTIRSSSTNSNTMTLFDMETDGTNIYTHYINSGELGIMNGVTKIPETLKVKSASGSDMCLDNTGKLYYAAIASDQLTLYQDGNFKEDISLPAPINTSAPKVVTLVDMGEQFVLYNDNTGRLLVNDVSLNPGEVDFGTFVIPDKKPVTITEVNVSDKIFDGSPVSYSENPVALDSESSEVVTVSGYDFTFYDLDHDQVMASVPRDVGHYRLTVSVSESDNTYTGTYSMTFEITPKTINITDLRAQDRAYDGTIFVDLVGGSLEGVVIGDIVTPVIPDKGRLLTKDVGTDKNVMVDEILLQGTHANNYELVQAQDLRVTITKADLSIENASATNKIYDGTNALTISNVNFQGLMNSETLVIGTDYEASAHLLVTSVGDAQAFEGSVTLKSSAVANNYQLLSDSINGTAVVVEASGLIATNPATIEMIKSQVRDYTFDLTNIGLNHNDVGSIVYAIGGISGDPIFAENPPVVIEGTTLRYSSIGLTEGSGAITIFIATQNYQQITATLTFVLVDKEPVTVTGVSVSDKVFDGTSITYSGSPIATVTETGSQTEGLSYDYTWYDLGNDSVLGSAPVKVGSYKLTIRVSEEDSLYSGFMDILFEITPKDVMVTGIEAISRPYDKTDMVVLTEGELVGVLVDNEVLLNQPLSGSIANVNAGEGKVVTLDPLSISGYDSGNYNLVQPQGILVTITTAPITISNITLGNKVYNGNKDIDVDAFELTGFIGDDTFILDVDFEIMAIASTANVGDDISAEVTASLLGTSASNNYHLANPVNESSVSISKASGLVIDQPNPLEIFRNQVKVYTFDPRTLTTTPNDLGEVTYEIVDISDETIFKTSPYVLEDQSGIRYESVAISTGSATMKLILHSQNYEDAEVIIDFILVTQVSTAPPVTTTPPTTSETTSPVTTPTVVEELADEVTPQGLPLLFKDVNGHWALGSIDRFSGNGFIMGYPDGTFRPNQAITRGEFVTMVIRALGLTESATTPFVDITQHWAKPYVEKAFAKGMITGTDKTHFSPDQPLTREQMAKILVLAYELKLVDDPMNYGDSDQISNWARDYVATLINRKVLKGFGDQTIRGTRNATRAEAVQALNNLIDQF